MRAVVLAVHRDQLRPGVSRRFDHQLPAGHQNLFVRQAHPLAQPDRFVGASRPRRRRSPTSRNRLRRLWRLHPRLRAIVNLRPILRGKPVSASLSMRFARTSSVATTTTWGGTVAICGPGARYCWPATRAKTWYTVRDGGRPHPASDADGAGGAKDGEVLQTLYYTVVKRTAYEYSCYGCPDLDPSPSEQDPCGRRGGLLQGSLYEVSLALVGVASPA